MFKYAAVVVTALVLTASGALGLAHDAGPSSYAGARAGASADGFVPPSGQDLSSAIASFQERLRRLPGDAPGWASLGVAYVEQARITGNPTYYGKADAVVARSFDVQPHDNALAHAAAAAVAAARHRFGAALREADAALAIDPRLANALAVRVDALT